VNRGVFTMKVYSKKIYIAKADSSAVNLPGHSVYRATYPDLNYDVVDALSATVSKGYGIESMKQIYK
jgi:hypothetical protein